MYICGEGGSKRGRGGERGSVRRKKRIGKLLSKGEGEEA